MKRLICMNLILFLFFSLMNAQEPEPVYSIARVDQPHSFFVKQAELWFNEIEKDGTNEKAWYFYYKANRYAKMTSGHNNPDAKKPGIWLEESEFLKEADEIRDLISEAIPNTFTYYVIIKEGYPNNSERFDALQKAYEIEPDNPDTYDEFVVYYETNSIRNKRKEFNQKWYQSNDFSSGILNYNYNVLMSMRKGGAIITFGDNDTFPIWMLQDALGIRPDITVLNMHLLSIPEYRQNIFEKLNIPALSEELTDGSTNNIQNEIIDHIIKNKSDDLPLYISTPAWKQIKDYDNNLYLVGLVFEYSKENIDNIALLKNNFENNYALDYIRNQFNFDISHGIVKRTNVNYLPGIIKLYQHYKLSGEIEKANKIKELGILIADKGGDEWKYKAAKIFK